MSQPETLRDTLRNLRHFSSTLQDWSHSGHPEKFAVGIHWSMRTAHYPGHLCLNFSSIPPQLLSCGQVPPEHFMPGQQKAEPQSAGGTVEGAHERRSYPHIYEVSQLHPSQNLHISVQSS